MINDHLLRALSACLDFGNFEPGNPSLTYGLTGLGARDTCMIILNQQKEAIPQEMAQGGDCFPNDDGKQCEK